MSKLLAVPRVVLGLVFVVFSANYFVPFLPQPALPPDALGFLGGFSGSGLLTLVKAIELVTGLALLSNRFVPLAITLLAPIAVGIAWFHARYEPSGLPLAGLIVVLELVLARQYRAAFAPLLHARAERAPGAATKPSPLAVVRAA